MACPRAGTKDIPRTPTAPPPRRPVSRPTAPCARAWCIWPARTEKPRRKTLPRKGSTPPSSTPARPPGATTAAAATPALTTAQSAAPQTRRTGCASSSCRNRKWEEKHQGKQICGIDSGESRLPEIMQPDLAAGIGINQNKSRKNEEETHAHVADCCERPEPMRTAQRSHFIEVKQRHMKRGKKTQGSDCEQAGAD